MELNQRVGRIWQHDTAAVSVSVLVPGTADVVVAVEYASSILLLFPSSLVLSPILSVHHPARYPSTGRSPVGSPGVSRAVPRAPEAADVRPVESAAAGRRGGHRGRTVARREKRRGWIIALPMHPYSCRTDSHRTPSQQKKRRRMVKQHCWRTKWGGQQTRSLMMLDHEAT